MIRHLLEDTHDGFPFYIPTVDRSPQPGRPAPTPTPMRRAPTRRGESGP